MEFFKVICPDKGEVLIDGVRQGANTRNGKSYIFQCNAGPHEIGLECLVNKKCVHAAQPVMLAGTNPIEPMEVDFKCVQ